MMLEMKRERDARRERFDDVMRLKNLFLEIRFCIIGEKSFFGVKHFNYSSRFFRHDGSCLISSPQPYELIENISSIVVINGRKKRLFLGREDNVRNRDGAIFVMSKASPRKSDPTKEEKREIG